MPCRVMIREEKWRWRPYLAGGTDLCSHGEHAFVRATAFWKS